MIYPPVRELAVDGVPVAVTCRVLGFSGQAFYAWDADPDGSYTLLDRYARDVVLSRAWPERLEWLRAAGVGAVIASDVPPGLAGLVPVYVEGRFGPPATLFRLAEPLPGIRRLSRVRGAASVDAAVAIVDEGDFDPATDGVVAGRPPEGTDAAEPDPSAPAPADVDKIS